MYLKTVECPVKPKCLFHRFNALLRHIINLRGSHLSLILASIAKVVIELCGASFGIWTTSPSAKVPSA